MHVDKHEVRRHSVFVGALAWLEGKGQAHANSTAFFAIHCSDRRMSLRLYAVKSKMQSILVNGVSGQVCAPCAVS